MTSLNQIDAMRVTGVRAASQRIVLTVAAQTGVDVELSKGELVIERVIPPNPQIDQANLDKVLKWLQDRGFPEAKLIESD